VRCIAARVTDAQRPAAKAGRGDARHLARVFPIQKCVILQLPSLWVCFIPEKLDADFLDFIQQLFVGPLKRRAAGILHHRGSRAPAGY
jgi:hypothetical protein